MSLDDEAAREARLRALGSADPRCSVRGCPETNPQALTGAHPHILCAEHRAMLDGRRPVEEHHVAGRHNGPATAWLLGNDHAILTFLQQSGWRTELLRNPDGDPLLRLEAAIRGSRQTLSVVLERALAPTEGEIRDLRDFLIATQGPDWATAFRAWLADRSHAP